MSLLSEHLNKSQYRVIAHGFQENSQKPMKTNYYLPDIYAVAKFREDFGAGEPSIFDTENNGGVETMDLLRYLGGYGRSVEFHMEFDRFELGDLFGEGNQFLEPVDPNGEINFGILHKKFIGEDAGKDNGSWDLVHFRIDILWNDGSTTQHTMLRR